MIYLLGLGVYDRSTVHLVRSLLYKKNLKMIYLLGLGVYDLSTRTGSVWFYLLGLGVYDRSTDWGSRTKGGGVGWQAGIQSYRG